MNDKLKKCWACKKLKPLSEFHKSSGKVMACKLCHEAYKSSRRTANRERLNKVIYKHLKKDLL